MNSFLRIGIIVAVSLVATSLFWRKPKPTSPPDSVPTTAPRFTDQGDAERFHLDLPALQFRQPAGLGLVLEEELTRTPLRMTPGDLAQLVLLAEYRITRADHASRLAVDTVLQQIEPSLLIQQPPERIKAIAITAFLNGLGPGGDLPARYNSASNTLAAVQRDGSWQCSTGTLLFQLAALRLPADQFRAQHFVLIYERGHVLPGYLRRVREAWHLFGVEMTVVGAGQKRYGPTAELARVGYALRIVEAPEALLVQSVAPFITNSTEAATAVLRRTAERYGIPLAGLERNIRDSAAIHAASTESRTNETGPTVMLAPWRFGTATVPPGDRVMMRIDRLDSRNNALSFSEVLALLPRDANSDDPAAPVEETSESETPTDSGDGPPKRLVYPWETDYPKN